MLEYFPPDALSAERDPVIYEVFDWPGSGLPTDLMVTVTAIHPGAVGGLAHHTKGHFHKDPDGAEIVVGMVGIGLLELVNRAYERRTIDLSPGTYATVEPGWAHRVVNPSDSPLLYLSVSSVHIGHDYESVQGAGWIPGLVGDERVSRS